jgi:hypothetical protein
MSGDVSDLYQEVRWYGITYLNGPHVPERAHRHLSPEHLLLALSRCEGDDRLRLTVIALLLLHPDWADSVDEALQSSTIEGADELAVMTLAACYLQQRWHLQLHFALGEAPHFPAHRFSSLWVRHGLPAPKVAFGESGLQALEVFERRRTGTTDAYQGAWDSPVRHLLWQERHRRPRLLTTDAIAPFTLVPSDGVPDKIAPIDRDEILRFVAGVTRRISSPDRLYLGSETAEVMGSLHTSTETIDLLVGRGVALSPAVETALNALRASPKTCWDASTINTTIPLPSQWQERAFRVCSMGALDVYGLDWATVAVAKIAQGTSWHLADVHALLAQGHVAWSDIEHAVAEMMPRLRTPEGYRNLDVDEFQQIFHAISTIEERRQIITTPATEVTQVEGIDTNHAKH